MDASPRDFASHHPEPRFDRYRDSMGRLFRGDEEVGLVLVLVEARQQRIAFSRLLTALRLPAGAEGDEKAGARQPRKTGARGVYGIRGVA